MDLYDFIDAEYARSFAGGGLFNEAINLSPTPLDAKRLNRAKTAHSTITSFFQTCLDLFYASIEHATDPKFSGWLLNDSRDWLPPHFYSEFRNIARRIPQFYRTDESYDGKVLEIQCPGSGWGDLELLDRVYQEFLPRSGACRGGYCISKLIEGLKKTMPRNDSSVFHMLDNASNPASMRYLITHINDQIPHWGFSRRARVSDTTLIRSHSVRGLIAENLFWERAVQAINGDVAFDLPPNPIFDQKLILCLPFSEETRRHFSNDVRDVIAYSSLATEDGFIDVNDEPITFRDLLKRPRKKRRYFCKYAGTDTSINWGSRSVFRLDGNDAEIHINRIIEDTKMGRPWIIQPEYAQKERILVQNRIDSEPKLRNFTSKYSCFYGPNGFIGMRSMHRDHFKVHGQPSTALGLPDFG
jgi:hypothetical protein